MSNLRQFYTLLLSISNQNLLETSYSELEEITGRSIFALSANISALKNIGVVESFFNCKTYNNCDGRIFIGLASPEIIDLLFRRNK